MYLDYDGRHCNASFLEARLWRLQWLVAIRKLEAAVTITSLTELSERVLVVRISCSTVF
jgi:hypothetical protein